MGSGVAGLSICVGEAAVADGVAVDSGAGVGLLARGGVGAVFTTFLPPQATKKAQQNIINIACLFTVISLLRLF